MDDGGVLDTPQDLAQAFQHAISTELALKGLDMSAEINLYRSKDGEEIIGTGSLTCFDFVGLNLPEVYGTTIPKRKS